MDNVENNCTAEKATRDNMAHARCMLDTLGYRHTLRIRNTGCFLLYNSGCTNTPQCYVVRTLPVLLL